MSELDHWSVTH